jgi:hemin uptake protein HemP
MVTGRDERAAPSVTGAAARGKRVLLSADVLRGAREVLIEHRGELYSLRETVAGKLILTK